MFHVKHSIILFYFHKQNLLENSLNISLPGEFMICMILLRFYKLMNE